MADIFLSYSRKDTEFMHRVAGYLNGAGFDVWTDEGITPGTNDWARAIERAIGDALTFVIILSPDAKNSEWIEREIATAQEKRIPIFPILLRGDESSSISFRLKTTQFVDARTNINGALARIVDTLRRELRSGGITDAPPTPSLAGANAASVPVVTPPAPVTNGVVRTVSRVGGADYRTINDALKNAPDGATIQVRPGLYRESLTLKRDIQIVGDGKREDITIESANANAVWMETDYAVLRGITIRVNTPVESGRNFFGIVVARGQLVVDDCDITSNVGCGIGIQGAQSDPRIRNSRIHNCSSAGVRVADNAQGKIEGCEITANKLSGLAILRGARFSASDCHLHHNRQNALLVNERGVCTIDRSRLSGNGFHGLEVATGGNITMRGCNLHGNQEYGIYIHGQSSGIIEECDVTNNKRKGFNIEDGSMVTRRNNQE